MAGIIQIMLRRLYNSYCKDIGRLSSRDPGRCRKAMQGRVLRRYVAIRTNSREEIEPDSSRIPYIYLERI